MSPWGLRSELCPGATYIGSPGDKGEPTGIGKVLLVRLTDGVLSILFMRHGNGHGTMPMYLVSLVNVVCKWNPMY